MGDDVEAIASILAISLPDAQDVAVRIGTALLSAGDIEQYQFWLRIVDAIRNVAAP